MASITIQNYTLHIVEASEVVWTNRLRTSLPSLYVEINSTDLKPMRTRVVRKTATPAWNEKIPLSAKSSSIISLALKRKNPFTADSALGSFDIELGALRDRCGNDDNTVIELRKREDGANGTIACLLTIKLDANDTAQLGALAVANARQDVELNHISTPIATYGTAQDAVDAVGASGSAFAQSLGCIVAKINVIVEVVDKTARLHPYANLAWQAASSLYKVHVSIKHCP